METCPVRVLQGADWDYPGSTFFFLITRGISLFRRIQDLVDSAPHFPEVLAQLEAFLIKNGLIDRGTKKRLKNFCWCSDGPCDIRDFAVKQCFISKVS